MDPIFAVLSSIATLMISGFVGYKLNSYLSRDRISIEEVTLFARKEQLTFETNAVRSLEGHRRAMGLGFPIDRFFDAKAEDVRGDARTPVLRGSETALEYQLYEYKREAEVTYSQLEKDSQHISALSPIANETDIPTILRHRLYDAKVLSAGHQQQGGVDVDVVREFVQKEIKSASDCIDMIKDCIAVGTAWKDAAERTGDLYILVTLLNSGDTDGLVHCEGELKVEGITGTIKLNLETEGQVVSLARSRSVSPRLASIKVEKRSMEASVFIIDKDRCTGEVLRQLTERVRKGESITYTIKLWGIRDNTISRSEKRKSISLENS